jgi:hypothetical protein
MRHARLALALTVALGATIGLGGRAVAAAPAEARATDPPGDAATPSAKIDVLIMLATNDGSGIDPKIGSLPQLGKPPFSAYNSYKLLDRPKISVTKGTPATVTLPNSRDLLVSLKDILPPKKKDDPTRYVLSASVQKPGGDTFLPLLEVTTKAGEWFFVAGQSYKSGTLVIGFKVLP